ncbi:universal stress protein [Mycobacterium neglectum]|uniref:universal stress protein n=1 Tax=Mycobacterium neglectum TaxID=242737 RepID=UPI001FE5FF3C|nr:universal stress protein [Mycobacterium neglectum]
MDGTTASRGAARWAAAVAEKFGAPLEIVNGRHATGRPLTDAAAALWAAAVAAQRESAETMLKSIEEEIRGDFASLEVSTLLSDEPVDVLLTSRSRRARLVVLGSDEMTPAAALVIGSTTLAVSAHSACPVIAWRGSNALPTNQPVVLGVDYEHTGPDAFRAAFDFADRFGLGLNAVHAWSAFRPPVDAITPYGVDWDALEALQWQNLLNTLDPWTELYPNVGVTLFVETEAAGKALMHHVADSQLVVVGSRGRNALAGALLGSTSLNLLHHSPVPVMLCHKVSGAA